jgi:DNA polymerase III delta prime subunit
LKGNKKDVEHHKGYLPTGTINSRAALLSGDPGLGKTTTARLLAK